MKNDLTISTTSLRVTHSDITVLRLDHKNQKINTLFQAPLPLGTITYGNIANPAKLETTIANALTQSRSQSQPIMMGFPEDKTFTTTLEITDVSLKDLNDAVFWQAQEVLPDDKNNLYFDWKLISADQSKNSTKHFVELVSVPKTFIDPIINAIIKSGAKPITCEPTSLSLARLAPKGETALIVEVKKTASTALIIDKFQTTRISTVVESPENLVSEITKMSTYFTTKNNQKYNIIYVCGEGATRQWQEFLSSQIKIKVAPLPLPQINNLPPNALNFAASLSLAKKNPSPPKDFASINLLPNRLQQAYQKQTEKQNLSFGFKSALITLGITAAILFVAFFIVQLNNRQLQSQIMAEEQSASQISYSQLANIAGAANVQANVIKHLPPHQSLTSIILQLEAAISRGINVSTYAFDLPEKVLLIGGLASTRDVLLQFKEKLESSDRFNLVTIPLPTLEKKQDIQFSLAVELAD